MSLAEPPELYALVPVYTKDGKQYGYQLTSVNPDNGPLLFRVDQIPAAVALFEDITQTENEIFAQLAAEAMDPNR